ncbi:EF-hand and coiled-coil domain-containing protein 1 isoform X2 [Hoplias malabaricus]|uniref:EF-hand and coiled-coil domain-containing protein 1 isoform X2 n=1 Tax=Hoplias malabaricus TaxID=27720 RepID=UPI0034619CD4
MLAPIRPARASEWLRCALEHHFRPELGVCNEVVVLALGIDQYLQEVFHHLSAEGELVTGEDFRLLCGCLGLQEKEEEKVFSDLPAELGFREFHSRLCGVFAARSGPAALRLPVTEQTELVEREIRLRSSAVRRRRTGGTQLNHHQPGNKKQTGHGIQEQVGMEMENAGLRELVEDLRSALQSSDARCMALEVALQRERLAHRHGETIQKQSCTSAGESRGKNPRSTRRENRRRTKDLLKELELIRASRDGQLQEAMRFNQRLEEEMVVAYEEVSRLEEALSSMRKESADIKKKAEEARGTLAAGLKRVRDIEDVAQQVTPLQEKVQSLKSELEKFRSRCTCGASCEPIPEDLVESVPREFPTGQELFNRAEEGLQRAVEGRAASDEEEEEERGEEEGQCCLLEVKRLINRLHNCSKGCQKMAMCHLLLSQNSTGHHSEQCGCSGSRETTTRGRRNHILTDQRELGKVDRLPLEVQMQTERVRLSLLEGKHTDTLTMLLHLRENYSNNATLCLKTVTRREFLREPWVKFCWIHCICVTEKAMTLPQFFRWWILSVSGWFPVISFMRKRSLQCHSLE